MARIVSKIITADGSIAVEVAGIKNRNRSLIFSSKLGFNKCVDLTALMSMPKGEGEEVKIVFFQPDQSKYGDSISVSEIEEEFRLRGLKMADGVSLLAINMADPTFVNELPHAICWENGDGAWCFARFESFGHGKTVSINFLASTTFPKTWWFAGILVGS